MFKSKVKIAVVKLNELHIQRRDFSANKLDILLNAKFDKTFVKFDYL